MISILFLAADPTDASRLRLGEEAREIREKLQLAKFGDKFTLHQRFSVRPSDMSQALLDVNPRIVHFSGHGTSAGALCLEDKLGGMHPIEPEALAALFEQFASQVSCVLLNACYSEIQAQSIAKHIDYVIGMKQEIGDKAAIAFAVGFYQALGAGRTIEDSYNLGCVQVRLENIPEYLTPVLIRRSASHVSSQRASRKNWEFHHRSEFVGRLPEKESFVQILERVRASETSEPQVLLINGEGGIGKSWLLNELGAECSSKGIKVFHIDLAVEEATGTSPKVVLYALREQANELSLGHYFSRFDDALRQLRLMDSENQDDFGLVRFPTSAGLISSRWLTDALVSDLNQIALEEVIVIAIDGSEKATSFANWLRSNLLARLQGRIVLIVSGRRDSLLEFVGSFGPSRVHQFRVKPFADAETEQFFHNHSIKIDVGAVAQITRLTKGNPLATSMLMSLAMSRTGKSSLPQLLGDLPHSEIVAGMARYLLADLSPDDLEMVYIMSMLPAFDGAILAYMLERKEDVNVEKYMQSLPFLSLTKHGWRMHENVARVVFDFFRQSRPTQFRRANERAAEYWQNRIAALEAVGIHPPQQYSNLEWATAVNYLFWHLMLSDEDKAAKFVLFQFSKALTHQVYFVTLLERADDLEESLLVIPRVAGILRSLHTNAIKGHLAQLEQSLLLALNLEYCNTETRAQFGQFLEMIRSSATETPVIPVAEARWHQYVSDCGDCDCDCGNDCACPIWSSEHGMVYYLELTPDCNNTCPGCSNTFVVDRSLRAINNGQQYLNANDWSRILTKLSARSTGLKLTGGEPTLHPQFAEILGTVVEIDIPFVLFTNARWSDPQGLVNRLKRISPLRGLLISLHGARASAHEAFTGIRGSFSETVANMRLAIEAGLSVSISTVLTSRNYDQIESIVDLGNELGASQVVFNRHIGFSPAGLELEQKALRRVIEKIERLKREGQKVRFGPCVPSCFASSSAKGCLAGTSFAAIDPWGNVKPCTHSSLVAGNLLQQSPTTIWNSEKMLLWDSLVPSECEMCKEYNECHGGCRAVGLLMNCRRDPLIVKPTSSTRQQKGMLVSANAV